MKFIPYLLFLMLVVSCKTAKMDNPKHIELVEATKQKWYGGQPGVEGTNYTLQFTKLTQDEIQIDSVKIENLWLPFKITSTNPIKITVSTINQNNKMKDAEQPEVSSFKSVDVDVKIIKPEKNDNYIGKNVVAYTINGKVYYYVIKDFKTSESISYP